jgi:superfamily II DNA or RNA helicase
LIVVKASIKIQWPKEIEKFSSYSSSILDTSSGVSSYLRTKIRKLEKRQQEYMDKDPYIFSKEIGSIEKEIKNIRKDEKQKFKDQFDADLLIANYETLNDSAVIKQLKKEPVEFVYADEIHVIKSPSAKRSRSLYKMNYVPYVFGATATPIQKNPVDVYSIYKFLKPGLFKDVNTFKSIYVKYNSFGFPIGAKNEDILNKRIKPYLVIKTQDEVSKELPELQVIPKYCILTPRQKHITDQLLDEIEDIKSQQQSIVSRYSSVDEARKQNAEMVKLDAQILAKQTFAQEIADSEDLLLYSDSKMAKQYITGSESGKIQLLLELMDEIFLSGEKVCVFSKYKRLQPILDAAILNRFKDIQIAHVNSDVSEEQRYEEIYTKFRDTDSCKVLLMSDAGAEGSNLERCQYLIEFEPADSYLIQTQRRGRIVRASSTHKTVYVYQLICEDSYDEIALKIVDKKRGFMHDIIES